MARESDTLHPYEVTGRAADGVDGLLAALIGVPCAELNPPVTVVDVPVFEDGRGWLAPVEIATAAGFGAVRAWAIGGVTGDQVRARHAHRRCAQALWCVSGSVRLVMTDGASRAEITLDGAGTLVRIPAGIWLQVDRFTDGAVLMTLADEPYDPADYRDSITRD